MTPEISSTFRFACEAMRSRFEIVISQTESSPHLTASDIRAAAEEAQAEIISVEGWLSAYRQDSALYRINAEAARHPVRTDGRLFTFLQKALELSIQSDGLFDLTVGPLLKIWGMGHGNEDCRVPDESDISKVLECVGMAKHVLLDEDELTVAFAHPGVRLDPGAIGKGYALDRAADILRDAGVNNALLHGGTSSVMAMGTPSASESGWRIVIRDPQNEEDTVGDFILRDEAIGVSAIHGKSFIAVTGERYGHVIDPRTGYPTLSARLSAVVTSSATEADALSTALLIASEDSTSAFSDRFPQVRHALRI
jgi:thiamine biosynthesis lipoprotein